MRRGHHHFHFLTFLGVVLLVGVFLYKVFFVNDFLGRILDRFSSTSDQIVPVYGPSPDSSEKELKEVIIRYPDGRETTFGVSGAVVLKGNFLRIENSGKTVVYWLPKGTKVFIRESN